MRFTTVNTDAGIKGNISAWAFWIRSDSMRYVHSGVFKMLKKDSNEAELASILIALDFVSRNEYLRTADIVVVNCDNQSAVNTLKDNRIRKDSIYYPAWQRIQENILAPIHFKWVKGHSKGKTSREWVNNYIDKQIRKHYQ